MDAPNMIDQLNYEDLGGVESLSAAERLRAGASGVDEFEQVEVEASYERLVGVGSMES